MAIDYVHDMQFAYRKILDSMSKPGQIASLKNLEGHNEYKLESYQATILTMLTLFDGEVTFHVLANNKENITERITAYTLAIPTSVEQADFIIVLEGTDETMIINALATCKKGSLIDPHSSATWLIETDFKKQASARLRLTGPGIKTKRNMEINLSSIVWEARNATASEYPLGIDFIFTDNLLQIACVPRTTKVDILEVE